MKKNTILIMAIFALLILLAGGLLILKSPEDSWICENGEWQKHGNPEKPVPAEQCGEVICPLDNIENCPQGCSICPPCEACSSISCQKQEFCESMGFEKDWYDSVKPKIGNFNECAAAGNPIMESYPRQCRAGGITYTEAISAPQEKSDLIVLDSPQPEEKITSPLVIKGKARGNWFFEASFPVILTNWDGLIIAQGIATAQGDWMTEEFVPFEATLEFEKPDYGDRGALILQKDNPSGLPQYDDALEITVFFQ